MVGSTAPDGRSARLRAAIAAEGDRFVTRLRDFSASRYRAAAPPFPDRAAVVRHLAQQAADAAAALEAPGGVAPQRRRLPTDLPDLALADVLAVTVGDAVLAAGERADPGLLAALLAELLLHRFDVDRALPGVDLAALAWSADPDEENSDSGRSSAPGGTRADPARFLAVARNRCPGS